MQIKKARAADIKGPGKTSVLHGRSTFLRRKLPAVLLHLKCRAGLPYTQEMKRNVEIIMKLLNDYK